LRHFSLAEIVTEIQPLGCIMAGDGGSRSWQTADDLSPKQVRQIHHRAERRKNKQWMKHWSAGEDADTSL
jgi:hypothetical protein